MIDQSVLESLCKLRDQIAVWKTTITDDMTFDEMVKSIAQGFSFGFKNSDLLALFDKTKKILIWTIQVINLIKKYEKDYKSKLLNETYASDLSMIINKNLVLFDDDYKQVLYLEKEKPSKTFKSLELEKLLELKEKSEIWSQTTKEVLQSKNDYDLNFLKGLIDEAGKFPTDMYLPFERRS